MKFSEDVLQVAAARFLAGVERNLGGMSFAGDQNTAKRGMTAAPLAKLMGLRPGEADLRIYLAGGKLVSVELKTDTGRKSPKQVERHALLGELGFIIYTIFADSPHDVCSQLASILEVELGCGPNCAMRSYAKVAADDVMNVLGQKNDMRGLAELAS